LLAKASGQPTHASQTHRFREQARSHKGFVLDKGICEHPQSLWERACSRRRRVSQNMRHRLTAFASKLAPTGGLCWTRESVNTLPSIIVGAGLLAKASGQPTHASQAHRFREQACSHRGVVLGVGIGEHPQAMWERACSRRRRISQHMRHRPTAFASKLAPTGDLCRTWESVNTLNHCGSRLAREGVGSAHTCFTGPPLSRASPLPQGVCAGQGNL